MAKKAMVSGLAGAVGTRVILLCLNYFYSGKLESLSAEEASLSDPSIVYETGPWTDSTWKDAQKLCRPVGVSRACIESWMPEKT
jgi:hypothetical protein